MATFRWVDDRWKMFPDPGLTSRLKRLALDHSAVKALRVRVDSAEVAFADFESQVLAFLRAGTDSEPERWRLRRAREFVPEMRDYLQRLRARGMTLAGAAGSVAGIDSLIDALGKIESRISREPGASPGR